MLLKVTKIITSAASSSSYAHLCRYSVITFIMHHGKVLIMSTTADPHYMEMLGDVKSWDIEFQLL